MNQPFLFALAASLTVLTAAPALASGSWSSTPSWASGGSSGSDSGNASTTRKGPYAKELKYGGVAPFSPGSNNLAVELGQVFLMGDLSSRYSDSIGAQVHYTYGVSDMFGFDSSIGYSDHSDSKLSMLTALTGLRVNLAWYDKVVPYLVGGLGFYRPSYNVPTGPNGSDVTTTSVSPLLFGIHLGPGVDLELTRNLYFGASLTFHDVFGSSKALVEGKPIDVGGTYASFLLHAGVTF